MPRSKVKVAFIEKRDTRKTSFRKRRASMLKKLEELTILCGIYACAIVYNPFETGEPVLWPDQDGFQRVLTVFMGKSTIEQRKKMLSHEGYLEMRMGKVQDQTDKQKTKNRERRIVILLSHCFTGEVSMYDVIDEDREDLAYLMDHKLELIQKRKRFLRSIAAAPQQPQQPPLLPPPPTPPQQQPPLPPPGPPQQRLLPPARPQQPPMLPPHQQMLPPPPLHQRMLPQQQPPHHWLLPPPQPHHRMLPSPPPHQRLLQQQQPPHQWLLPPPQPHHRMLPPPPPQYPWLLPQSPPPPQHPPLPPPPPPQQPPLPPPQLGQPREVVGGSNSYNQMTSEGMFVDCYIPMMQDPAELDGIQTTEWDPDWWNTIMNQEVTVAPGNDITSIFHDINPFWPGPFFP